MLVAARYQAALAASGHKPDAAQLRAVARLDALLERLQAAAAKASAATPWWQLPFTSLGFGAASRSAATPGLYLYGGVGRGKTFLMDLFHAALPPVQARRVHFNRFMQEVHARLRALGEIADPLQQVAADLAREARVLCFDELHVNDIADAMLLGGLFDALVNAGTTLVFTSNVPPTGLYRDGLQRARFLPAIALLERHCLVLAVEGGQDYRLRELQRAPLYLDSAAATTPAALASRFHSLTGNLSGDGEVGRDGTNVVRRAVERPVGCASDYTTDCHVELAGRSVPCVREAGDVIWFTFTALCEGPRGQADYIELACNYGTVLLQDVPVLAAEQDNAARRLVSLVDEFYDRGVKLVVSAAAPPTALYTGERLAFEFQRTASRLIEMQSHDYLARPHQS
jgi:cell division protein ZapE